MKALVQDMINGYLLLPQLRIPGYRGVDRDPFIPTFIDAEMISTPKKTSYIWESYPLGWRRDAYKLYEENVVQLGLKFDLYLISNLDIANEIQSIIQPHLGVHDIFLCEISNIYKYQRQSIIDRNFLGYDVAYLGGDLYSALLNGLFINPPPILINKYKAYINKFGLFHANIPYDQYVSDFKCEVKSEQKSDFYLWKLLLVQ